MSFNLALVVLKQELLKPMSIIVVLLLAFFFISVSMIIINLPSFSSFLFANYLLPTKLNILFELFIGTFYATSQLDVALVSILGILFGMNMTLLINKFSALRGRGNLRIMTGTGIVSIVAAGCASCGLSFASLIGISAALAVLPFGGIELYFLAIFILLISIYFNLKQIIKVCKITSGN